MGRSKRNKTPKSVKVDGGESSTAAAVASSTGDEVFHRFDIEFDAGPEPVFHGGELCTGSLRVCLKKQITINAIRVQFKGRACWLGQGSKDKPEEKLYFDKDFVLLERPPGHPEPGHFPWNANFTYSLPFECPLPKGCPTSYESPRAFVRYFARATFQTDSNGGQPLEYMIKKCFNIIAPPELHELVPPQPEAVHRAETIAFGGCCCRGQMTAEVALPKHSYAPGENVIGTFAVSGRHAQQAIEQVEVRLVDKAQLAPDPADEPIIPPDIQQPAPEEVKGKRKVKKIREISASKGGTLPHKGKVSPLRTLVLRQLEKSDVVKSKGIVTRSDVFFLTIPPLPASTISERDVKLGGDENGAEGLLSLPPDAQISKLLESPSTATLKLRRQPFIKVDYVLQVLIGPSLLVEVPVEIHPIALYANGIGFRPSPAGAVPVGEPEEAGKQLFHAPFTFEPLYPTYLQPSRALEPGLVSRQVMHETVPVPNGVAELTKTAELSELPDGSRILHRKEEYVVIREYTQQQQETPAEPSTQLPAPVAAAPHHLHEHHHHHHATTSSRVNFEDLEHTHSVPAEALPNDVVVAGEALNHVGEMGDGVEAVIVEHHERDEQLENGHAHIVDEVVESPEGTERTHRVVEDAEYEDEHGAKVHFHKTMESTVITPTTIITAPNGDDDGEGDGDGGD